MDFVLYDLRLWILRMYQFFLQIISLVFQYIKQELHMDYIQIHLLYRLDLFPKYLGYPEISNVMCTEVCF